MRDHVITPVTKPTLPFQDYCIPLINPSFFTNNKNDLKYFNLLYGCKNYSCLLYDLIEVFFYFIFILFFIFFIFYFFLLISFQHMLSINVNDRFSVDDCLSHEFLNTDFFENKNGSFLETSLSTVVEMEEEEEEKMKVKKSENEEISKEEKKEENKEEFEEKDLLFDFSLPFSFEPSLFQPASSVVPISPTLNSNAPDFFSVPNVFVDEPMVEGIYC
jgi:serine/threonine protein kinase